MHIDHRAATHIQNERLRAAARHRTRRDDPATQRQPRPGFRHLLLHALRGVGAIAAAATAPWSTTRRHA